jgi:hypothetical protein
MTATDNYCGMPFAACYKRWQPNYQWRLFAWMVWIPDRTTQTVTQPVDYNRPLFSEDRNTGAVNKPIERYHHEKRRMQNPFHLVDNGTVAVLALDHYKHPDLNGLSTAFRTLCLRFAITKVTWTTNQNPITS